MIKSILSSLVLLFLISLANAIDGPDIQKYSTIGTINIPEVIKRHIKICDSKDCKGKWYKEYKKNESKKLSILKFYKENNGSKQENNIDYVIEVEAIPNKNFTNPKEVFDNIIYMGTSFTPVIEVTTGSYDSESLSSYGTPFVINLTLSQPNKDSTIKNGRKIIDLKCKIIRVYQIDKNKKELESEELDKRASKFLFGRDDLIHSFKMYGHTR